MADKGFVGAKFVYGYLLSIYNKANEISQDVGDATGSLGVSLTEAIGYEGTTSLADKLTADRVGYMDKMARVTKMSLRKLLTSVMG